MNTPLTVHCCSVPGCQARVASDKLMCRRHWARVPYALRRRVWDAWEKYQEGALSLFELRQVQARATAAVKGGGA